jgi:hypothetical protein
MTVISDRPFSALNENGWTDFWGVNVVSDPTAPRSPSSVGQQVFPAGFGGGSSTGVAGIPRLAGTTYHTLYISGWLKISSNWQGHLTSVNKVLHINVGGINHAVFNLWGVGSGKMQAGILLQGIVNDGAGNTWANWYPNLGPAGEIVRGQWHHVEIVLVGNTVGAANGRVDWWLDGAKIGSHTGIQFVAGDGVWDDFAWSPTWGGLGDVVRSTMTMSFDHLYLSGKR